METTETALEVVPREAKSQGVVSLAVTPEQLVEHYRKYEEIKKKLLTPTDYVTIAGKQTIAKSGWFKLGVAFNLDTLIIKEERREKGDLIAWEIALQCRAPNGRIVQEIGLCDNSEGDRKGDPEHVLKAMAMTRATERAYIKMLGAPDHAAEDMPENGTPHTATEWCQCKEKKPKFQPPYECYECGKPVEPSLAEKLLKGNK